MAAYVQDVFMVFGDSITQGGWEPDLNGFGQRLSHVYARKLDVLNRGLSGYNTEWGIPVFEQCIAKRTDKSAPKLRVLAIWFGANDACIKPSPQHVPLATFTSNLKHMVDMIKSPTSGHYSPTTRIILISPPPVNTFARGAALASRNPPLALDREFEITRAYAEAVRDVALAEGVAFVDVWTALWEAAGKEEQALSEFLGDGLHLNGNGYQVMYEELIKTIAKKYPEVHYDNLGYVFPPWAEIDWENPGKSLYVKKEEA
ncbi:SGNH hydrolase-type esterase domain-containing protein [Flammula alnicola]|nr:SGNH hydrolase-type esterase domain-containing protein [Flammula alnicola]